MLELVPKSPGNITSLSGDDRRRSLRMLEALLFASERPLTEETLAARLPDDVEIASLLEELQHLYGPRGVNLVQVADGWAFQTADDLSFLLSRDTVEPRKLSRAAMETLAIIAYHQPVTRAEIEEIRGVATSKGTLDILLETGWVRLRGRRRSPGRPVTFGTTPEFLHHFGLVDVGDLPGLEELRGSGMLEGTPPAGFKVPLPSDVETLTADEDPLDADDTFNAF